MKRFFITCCLLLSVLSQSVAQQAVQTPPAPPPVVAPSPLPIRSESLTPYEVIDKAATGFFARYPVLPATGSWIGNSSSGTTETTKIWGRTKLAPDGAPLRTHVPANARRVALEWSADGKTVLIRVESYWNEAGYQQTYLTPEGQVVGGMQDVGFPRQDIKNRTPANQWQFGTGFWVDGAWPDGGGSDYRENLPFVELKQGPDSGYPGYSWRSDDGGLVIKTPKTTIYGLIGFGAVVTDPANPNLAFSTYNAYTLNWAKRGGGKEQAGFAPTFDYAKYPTDPRRSHAASLWPGVFGVVRVEGELYTYTGENEVMLHRWDAADKLLVPVAALYLRPDELPSSIPGHPPITWGQGAIARAGIDGNYTADRWQVIPASLHGQRGSSFVKDVDPAGDLYLLPKWSKVEDANPVTRWKTFDMIRGVFSPDNVSYLQLPDALKSANACESVRIDWASGDLVAVAQRDGKWMLERYAGWQGQTDAGKAALTSAYSVGPVALNIRTQFPPYAKYNKKWGASVDPNNPLVGFPTTGFATMVIGGDYVFLAEVQGGGVRVHRLSDGAIAGRMSSRNYLNSSVDNATQMQATETPSEFRIFLVDFSGHACLVWRVSKAALAAGVLKSAIN